MVALTELEQMILGVIGLYGPCTGYRIRQVFLDSMSPHWSGSAGAIYPALRRLEQRRLIVGRAEPRTRRPSRSLSLSRDGERALGSWLAPPLDAVALFELDPLRTRVRMLGLVAPAERRRFLAAAAEQLTALEEQASALLRTSRRGDDPFHTLSCELAVQSIRLRRRWLAECAKCPAIRQARRR